MTTETEPMVRVLSVKCQRCGAQDAGSVELLSGKSGYIPFEVTVSEARALSKRNTCRSCVEEGIRPLPDLLLATEPVS